MLGSEVTQLARGELQVFSAFFSLHRVVGSTPTLAIEMPLPKITFFVYKGR